MYNSKLVSIKQIADKIKRGKYYENIPFESILDYAVDAMSLINSEKYFITLPAIISINHFKAALPCGFEYMLQCTKYCCKTNTYIPMRTGTDNFHEVYDKVGKQSITEYTYSLNNNTIFTNFKEGELFIVYKSLPVDKDNYPLIPDNVNVKLCIENYIKYNYLDDMGSDEQAVIRRRDRAEQEYQWYVGKAQAEATNMTLDEMESFSNSMSNLFSNPLQFKERMEYLGTQEFLKLM